MHAKISHFTVYTADGLQPLPVYRWRSRGSWTRVTWLLEQWSTCRVKLVR